MTTIVKAEPGFFVARLWADHDRTTIKRFPVIAWRIEGDNFAHPIAAEPDADAAERPAGTLFASCLIHPDKTATTAWGGSWPSFALWEKFQRGKLGLDR